jgi:hypothetical protein
LKLERFEKVNGYKLIFEKVFVSTKLFICAKLFTVSLFNY